jgi:hypothetical protein
MHSSGYASIRGNKLARPPALTIGAIGAFVPGSHAINARADRDDVRPSSYRQIASPARTVCVPAP